MPYIRGPGEPRPWFGELNDSLDQMIALNAGTGRLNQQEAMRQAEEARGNAEWDRRSGQQNARADTLATQERGRKAAGTRANLDLYRSLGAIPQDVPMPEGDALSELDLNGLVHAYAQKVMRDRAESERLAKEAASQAEAARLQRTLGVGLGTPGSVRDRTPEEGLYLAQDPTIQTPGTPGEQFRDPNSVESAARIMQSRESAAVTEANRQRDDQRSQQQIDINRQRVEAYVQSVQAKGTPPSEEDIAGLADAIQASNPGIPASQAMGIARARLQYKAPMQIPTETLAQKGEAENLKGQIGTLRSIRQSLLGTNGRAIAKKLGTDMGIPEIPSTTLQGRTDPDMVKIFDVLDGQIGDLEAKRRTMGMAPPGGSAAASGGGQYPPDVVTPQDRAEYDALFKANAGGGR